MAGKRTDDGTFVQVMDGQVIQPSMIITGGLFTEADDWLVLSVAQDVAAPRKMLVELQHLDSGKRAKSRLALDDTFERKVYGSLNA